MDTWRRLLVGGGIVLALAAVSPPAVGLMLVQMVAIVSTIAMWRGARRAPVRRPWVLYGLGMTAFLAGNMVRAVHGMVTGVEPPFPSPADALYYAGYICAVAGTVCLHRARRPRGAVADLVDALTVATGVGLAVWAFVMVPYAHDGSVGVLARSVNIGYSVFDLLLVGVAARVATGAGIRNRSYYLLAGSFAATLVTDLVATLSTVSPALLPLQGLFAGICFLLAGSSALHPSMRALTDTAKPRPVMLTRRRLVTLLLALAVAPIVLLIQHARGRGADAMVVTTGTAAMCALVLFRMALLVRANERRARQEQVLRRASEELASATSREAIHDGALTAALALAEDPTACAVIAMPAGDEFEVVAARGCNADARIGSRVDPTRDSGVAVRLVSQNLVQGLLAVTAAQPLDETVVDRLHDLGSSTALALHRQELDNQLRHQALHDALTGLANRVLFTDRLEHALAQRAEGRPPVAILFIDLDDFKTINDTLGHAAGDQLIVAVADCLKRSVRTGDTAARLGGDEFAILLEGEGHSETAIVVRRLQEALAQPFVLGTSTVHASASVGIAIDEDRTATADTLLRNADEAMYLAKAKGKGHHKTFDESMSRKASGHLA